MREVVDGPGQRSRPTAPELSTGTGTGGAGDFCVDGALGSWAEWDGRIGCGGHQKNNPYTLGRETRVE